MIHEATEDGWLALLRPEWLPALAVLVGGVLLHSMNVLLLATVLPSIVVDVGGAALMSWPTTAFLASSIVAATCTGLLTAAFGARRAFCTGAVIFGSGALVSALAASMAQVIAGRFVQGFGGGLLSGVAYILVRSTFPERVWPRALALMAGAWSVAILVGPLVGGVFAQHGDWRSAFTAVTVMAALLAVAAVGILPRAARDGAAARPGVPGGRVALTCVAIVAMSGAAVVTAAIAKAALIAVAIAALAAMLRLDRAASTRLLPSDAFSLGSVTGVGLWSVLMLSIGFSPMHIYVPIFLQRLHGLAPLSAGYATACASMAWTVAALAVAGVSTTGSSRLLVVGPLVMATGLFGVGMLSPAGPLAGLLPAIAVVGLGIGTCWAFAAQRVMAGARSADATLAASAVATVQQIGFALGAALAGLVANTSGLAVDADLTGMTRAAFWVPASFAAAAVGAGITGLRLATLTARAGSARG